MERNVIAALAASIEQRHSCAPARPITITISRDHGAGGDELALALATRLHTPLADQQILNKVAARLHVSPTLAAQLDEDLTATKDMWLSRWLGGDGVTPEAYVVALQSAIRSVARDGAIILGRGAHVVLGDTAALRLRVVGSVACCAERYRIGQGTVALVNSRRALFVWEAFQRRLATPSDYDLVVNTDRISDFGALADLIVSSFLGWHQSPFA